MFKRKLMRTRELRPGMKVDHPIVDRLGQNLIARGGELDEYIIKSLIQRGIMTVYIQDGYIDENEIVLSDEAKKNVDKLRTEDSTKLKLDSSIRERVATGIQFVYNNPDDPALIKTTSSIADSLMSAISANDATAIDISSLKTSDEYTFKHSVDVATIAMVVAKKLKLPEKDIFEIGITGLLHDIGKTKIPIGILNKPGRLDNNEFAIMKQHTVFGYQMIKDREDLSDDIKCGVLQHHEKTNGAGYPLALNANKICPYARILSVADIYDALVTERPYKTAMSQRESIELIMSMTQELDMKAMDGFLRSMILYPIDSVVELSNGENAVVVKNNPAYLLRPVVVSVKTGMVYDLANDINCASLVIL